jgi:hypothetical protein
LPDACTIQICRTQPARVGVLENVRKNPGAASLLWTMEVPVQTASPGQLTRCCRGCKIKSRGV